MMRPLDEQIRAYYESQSLDDDALQRLARSASPPRARSVPWTMIAASILFAAVVGALLWLLPERSRPEPLPLDVAIAREAALGHNQNLEPEFRETDLRALRARMQKLDFTPVDPSMSNEMGMELLGARYHSLGGHMAAQLRYLDRKGELCTLYQLRPIGEIARLGESEHTIDGVLINIWNEKGLVMVLARPLA